MGESDYSSGKTQSGKGLQSKSQFRTIAPKIAPKVPASKVLPCQSPSLSNHLSLRPSISSKPLVMSPQNYTVMQVAGHEGTFSLVTFPHVASVQPNQKTMVSLPENLKLPIPRYQPPKSSKASKKKASSCSSKSNCSKTPLQIQICMQGSPLPASHPDLPHKTLSSRQVLSRDEALVTIHTDGGGLRDRRAPSVPNSGDVNTLAAPQASSLQQAHTKDAGTTTLASKTTLDKPPTVQLAKTIASLSQPVLGNAIQPISSVPDGKLSALPHSRMKTTETYKIESHAHTEGLSVPATGVDCDKMRSSVHNSSPATKVAHMLPAPQGTRLGPSDCTFCPFPKLELNHKPKLNSGAGRRRARKQKLPDNITTFQGKRGKCSISSKSRDGKGGGESNPQESKNNKPLKKYRSIMPKPVLLGPVWTSLASPTAMPPSQTSCGLGLDPLVNHLYLLTTKSVGCKENEGPSTKPGFAFQNGCSSLKKPWHRCQVCNHHFQFKQHLRDHMDTHTNRRPYSCRMCRKTYMRPGSLSAHVKLHHAETRPRRLVCCQFCAKVFGHMRVYLGHLKEVHRVLISTEPCPSSRRLENRDRSMRGPEGSGARENKPSLEEDVFLNQVDSGKLQIKCGHCQTTTQSFAEIKFHLLYVHGEEIQDQLQGGILPGSQVQEELVKHAAPYWKQHPEKRKLVKHCCSEEGLHAFPKLKKQLYFHQQNNMQIQIKTEGTQPETSEPGEDTQGPKNPTSDTILFCSHSGFNCLLCAQTLGRREELLLHWERQHNCEDPSRLWTILNSFCKQGVIDFSSKTEN
ncbi:PREDICTED: zinc finger protein 438-like [Elephantulus edwardii]|uniref:zinc finger protein 438-like n=1 Tax=Elephantulus edwardii TaxID=28737 RepID=UPI0003F0C8DD|nr:PREDICTED: zinc finger protein 438-like [Elephantulus edwardii]